MHSGTAAGISRNRQHASPLARQAASPRSASDACSGTEAVAQTTHRSGASICDGTTHAQSWRRWPEVGRDHRQSDESRCVSHQLGSKAFRTPLCNSLDDQRKSHSAGSRCIRCIGTTCARDRRKLARRRCRDEANGAARVGPAGRSSQAKAQAHCPRAACLARISRTGRARLRSHPRRRSPSRS